MITPTSQTTLPLIRNNKKPTCQKNQSKTTYMSLPAQQKTMAQMPMAYVPYGDSSFWCYTDHMCSNKYTTLYNMQNI
eukprot:15228783-Ditylum_brightwellii.AAC.1